MRQLLITTIAAFGGWLEAYLISDLGPTLGVVYCPVVMTNIVIAHAITKPRHALLASAAATVTLAGTISYWWIGRGYLSSQRLTPALFLILGAIVFFVGSTAFVRHLKRIAAAHDDKADLSNQGNEAE